MAYICYAQKILQKCDSFISIVYKGLKFVSEQKNAFMADGNLRLTVPKARNILLLKVRKIEF